MNITSDIPKWETFLYMCLKKDSLLNIALIADLDPEVVSLDVKQFGKYIRDDGPVNRYFRN